MSDNLQRLIETELKCMREDVDKALHSKSDTEFVMKALMYVETHISVIKAEIEYSEGHRQSKTAAENDGL